MSKSYRTAEECGLAYLDRRMRTVFEMRTHLEECGFGPTEIEQTIKEFLRLKYLDDSNYAIKYFEYNREKHRGGKRAKLELEKRGVDKQTINNAYEDYLYENSVDEFEDAYAWVRRELAISAATGIADMMEYDADSSEPSAYNLDEKQIASFARKLEARGFEYKDISRILNILRRG